MGRSLASKKNPDETNKRKNPKSAKPRRRRRRRDSSPISLPSDSDGDSRGRKKKRSRPGPKRSSRGEDPSHLWKRPKKPNKSKTRKSRHQTDSSPSSNSSGRSCSTCRGSSSSGESARSRSRSPSWSNRRLKSKDRGRSKGRDRGRKRRYRSCSRSSCSGCSSSPSRNDRKRNYREKHGSIRAKTKAFDDGDRDKIIQTYDDFRPSRSNDGLRQAPDKESQSDGGEDGNSRKKGVGLIPSNVSNQPAKNSDDHIDDSVGRKCGLIKDPLEAKNLEVATDADRLEAEDLELILRKKALENFRKFRGGISTGTRSLGDRKDEVAGAEACKDVGSPSHGNLKSTIKSVVCMPVSSMDDRWCIESVDSPTEVKTKPYSVAKPVTCSPDDIVSSVSSGDRKIKSSKEGSKIQILPTRVGGSSNQLYSEKVSSANINQDNRAAAEPGISKSGRAEASLADGSASGVSFPSTETQNCKYDEPVAGDASGSQFQQRTFSRVHDGETVQVSYKVYIPKKSPALARRQLQR